MIRVGDKDLAVRTDDLDVIEVTRLLPTSH